MTRRIALALLVAIAIAATLGAQTSVKQPAHLLITGGTVVAVDTSGRVVAPGAVAIRGTDIVAVGARNEVAAAYTAARVIDATGRVVMPGLVNTHGHAPMVLYRGLADDLALMEWLQKYIFPAEAKTVTPA